MVVVLGFVEIGAIAFLGHAFLPAWVAWVLDAVGGVLLIVSAVGIASVLWRRHRLTESEVLLALGYLAHIRVPLSCVGAVTVLPPLAGVESGRTGPTIDDVELNLVAAPGVPRFAVDLTAPVSGWRLWQRRPVHRVLASDDTGLLAAALLARRSA